MNEASLTFRKARRANLMRMVQLLADDPLGSMRETEPPTTICISAMAQFTKPGM